MNRTFSEWLRFPGVDKPARIVLKKRDAKNAFVDIWTTKVNPSDKFIVRAGALASAGPLIKLHGRAEGGGGAGRRRGGGGAAAPGGGRGGGGGGGGRGPAAGGAGGARPAGHV